MTQCTAATPAVGPCHRWRAFLREVTEDDPAGALPGPSASTRWFFLYGLGANGKSVFLNTITGILEG
jgi:putative DNA primase/helicase